MHAPTSIAMLSPRLERHGKGEIDMAMITTADARYAAAARPSATNPLVFVIHDDVSVRESLELLIDGSAAEPETYASAQEFLDRPRTLGPSCLILDVALPDLNGLDFQTRLARERPEMPIIFVTAHGDVSTSVAAMKAGAIEFLTRPYREDVLLAAIELALERSRRAIEHEARLKALRENYRALTPREREVMTLVVSGLLNKQVGGELGISEITVKAHRGQVMRKMRAGSLPALVTMVSRLGVRTAPTV